MPQNTTLTIGTIATFHDRIGIVEDTINSLSPQIDLLFVYCNDEISYRNARKSTDGNIKKYLGPNITDRGKFYFCKEMKNTDFYYFTFDDDLIYPPDYIQKTVEWLKKYENKAVLSYHGKKLLGKIDKYYRSQTDEEDRNSYRCLHTVEGIHEVDIIGTGCMAFHLQYFCPEDLQFDMMADIEVSVLIRNQKLKAIVLPHSGGWIRYNPRMTNKWTIWDEFQKKSDALQTRLVNENF